MFPEHSVRHSCWKQHQTHLSRAIISFDVLARSSRPLSSFVVSRTLTDTGLKPFQLMLFMRCTVLVVAAYSSIVDPFVGCDCALSAEVACGVSCIISRLKSKMCGSGSWTS